MEIINKKIDELIPYVNNPRQHTNVDKIASSIKNFGFKQPIVLDANSEIIVGHGRLLAAKKLKLKEVPCVIADDLTDAQIKAFRIADNKVAEYSEWDKELLEIELDGLEDMFTGFDIDDINVDMDSFGEDFELPSGDKEPFQQMTFTLADAQAEIIKNAIDNIKQSDTFKYIETFGNENSNGNALYCLIQELKNG